MKYILLVAAFLTVFAGSLSAQDKLTVDTKSSKLNWAGNKVVGGHWGTVDISSGSLNVNSGKLVGGEFVINLKTIKSLDLKENEGKSKLEGHLMSDDFFATDKFPTAKLVITKAEESKQGKNNYNITGDLTIRGITHSITFPAKVDLEKGKAKAYAEFNIDRTKWDIKYNSGNFFKDLGDRMIKDEIEFKVNLHAKGK